jgi:hypothetical protein
VNRPASIIRHPADRIFFLQRSASSSKSKTERCFLNNAKIAKIMTEEELRWVTRYIKNWADSAKIQGCSSHLNLCGLTVNRSVLPNFSYTHPLAVSFKKQKRTANYENF